MWVVQNKIVGEAARSGANLKELDKSRFADYQLLHTKQGISLKLCMYLPTNAKLCRKVIFSIHGIKRNANKYRNIIVPHVQNENVLVVAPSFTDEFYKSSLSIKMGNMCQGTLNPLILPKEEWTFTHLYEAFLLLKKELPSLESFSLFGHSAGAQFVHRMALFTDYPELESVVAANSGWYTVLDNNIEFPYGTRGLVGDETARRLLKKRIVFMSGAADTEQDAHLRVTKKALVQGSNRLERAKYMIECGRKQAQKKNVEYGWILEVVPGVQHSSRGMAGPALKYLT